MTLPKADGRVMPRAELMRIDAVCDRFERAWRAGDRPELATFLAEDPGPPPARARLFHGLLTLEVEFRIGRGEIPDPRVYLDRFPEYATLIPAVFAGFDSDEASTHAQVQGTGALDTPNGISQADTRLGEGLPRAELGFSAIEALHTAGYEILGELGRGGMGVVYLARKLALNRPCALKMILAGPHAGSSAAARFRAEAAAVARLQHPGIVQIYHVGEAGDLPFLELEYLPGGSLDRALDGTPWPPAEAARLVEVLARAIKEAHDKGIVHRDLKPANVLFGADGSAKIADFGLAKVLDSDSNLTRTHVVLGTPSYLAPEQAEGRSQLAGATTDIYALGAILYELLTGGPPFRAATALETLALVKSADPVSPSRLQPGLPRDLETICLKCLEKAPNRRYPRAEDLAEDLRRYQAGELILARPAAAWERAWRWARRRPTVATALAVGGTALGLLFGGALYHNAQLQVMLRRARVAERSALDRGRLAIDAYSRLVTDVQERLGESAATRSIRQDLLTTAIQGLEEVARGVGGGDPDLDRAVAHQKLGEILRQVGRADDARQQFVQSIRQAEALSTEPSSGLRASECLRDAYLGLGELILRDERPVDAAAYFRLAVRQAETVAAAGPGRAGAQRGLIESYHRLGRAHEAANEPTEAEERFRAMHELAVRWVGDEPASLPARDSLASSHLRLARARRRANDLAAAQANYAQAVAIAGELTAEQPRNLEYKSHLALALIDSAIFALDLRKSTEARPLLVRSLGLYTELVNADPEDRETQVWLIHALFQSGRLERDEEQFAKAEADFQQALDRLRKARSRREARRATRLQVPAYERPSAGDRVLRGSAPRPRGFLRHPLALPLRHDQAALASSQETGRPGSIARAGGDGRIALRVRGRRRGRPVYPRAGSGIVRPLLSASSIDPRLRTQPR